MKENIKRTRMPKFAFLLILGRIGRIGEQKKNTERFEKEKYL